MYTLLIKDMNSSFRLIADCVVEYDNVVYIDGQLVPAEFVTLLTISFKLF